MSPESRDIRLKVTVDTREFEVGIERLRLAFERMAVSASKASLAMRKFAWWADYTAFFNHPAPSAALLRRVEAVWP